MGLRIKWVYYLYIFFNIILFNSSYNGNYDEIILGTICIIFILFLIFILLFYLYVFSNYI